MVKRKETKMIEVTNGDEYKANLSCQAILWLLLHKEENTEFVIAHEAL